jgi:serine protease Do
MKPELAVDPVKAAIREVFPALVRIQAVTVAYQDGREVKTEVSGSGVIFSPDGYVITNHHVAGNARRIRCILSDRREVDARLVGTDPLADIAVVKLDANGLGTRSRFPSVTFGDSARVTVGDRVLAMGCPLALSQSVTTGIVSNPALTMPEMFWPYTLKLDGETVGTLVRWIGHDAQIFPGNSGGPLVDLQGRVIGINDISVGLGAAIPGNLAREVAEELVRHGRVNRSWLGLGVQPLLQAAEASNGVLISDVVPGSPADASGLKPGDILLEYRGRRVRVGHKEELPEFHRFVLETPVGEQAECLYVRGGQKCRTLVTSVARGTVKGKQEEFPQWGITVAELTLLGSKERKREPYSGLLITGVRPGGAAASAKPALRPEDILTAVDGKPLHSLDDLRAVSQAPAGGQAGSLRGLVAFERCGQQLLTLVDRIKDHSADTSAEARKAWLPITTQVLTRDLAQALGLGNQTGVRVTRILLQGAATSFKVGDILLEVDGQAIEAAQGEDDEVFDNLIRQYPAGSHVSLKGLRAGKPLTVETTLDVSPPSRKESSEYRDTCFEFRAREITHHDRVQHQWPAGQTGALITTVDAGGWAALAHLAVDDLVLAVDGRPVSSVADLQKQVERATARRRQHVILFVRRGVHTLFLDIQPDWNAN